MDRSALAPDALFSCAGQVAIVTGAGTGIGRTCAEALAAAGARVALAGLADSEPERAAAELVAQGADAFGIACDVTDAAQLARLVGRDGRPMGPDRHRARQRRRRTRPARCRRLARTHGPHVRPARPRGRRARRTHAADHRRRRRGSVPHHVEPVGSAWQPRALRLRGDQGRERAARPQHRRAVGRPRHPRQCDLAGRDRDRVRRADHRRPGCRRRRDSRRHRSVGSGPRTRWPVPWSGSPPEPERS